MTSSKPQRLDSRGVAGINTPSLEALAPSSPLSLANNFGWPTFPIRLPFDLAHTSKVLVWAMRSYVRRRCGLVHGQGRRVDATLHIAIIVRAM